MTNVLIHGSVALPLVLRRPGVGGVGCDTTGGDAAAWRAFYAHMDALHDQARRAVNYASAPTDALAGELRHAYNTWRAVLEPDWGLPRAAPAECSSADLDRALRSACVLVLAQLAWQGGVWDASWWSSLALLEPPPGLQRALVDAWAPRQLHARRARSGGDGGAMLVPSRFVALCAACLAAANDNRCEDTAVMAAWAAAHHVRGAALGALRPWGLRLAARAAAPAAVAVAAAMHQEGGESDSDNASSWGAESVASSSWGDSGDDGASVDVELGSDIEAETEGEWLDFVFDTAAPAMILDV